MAGYEESEEDWYKRQYDLDLPRGHNHEYYRNLFLAKIVDRLTALNYNIAQLKK